MTEKEKNPKFRHTEKKQSKKQKEKVQSFLKRTQKNRIQKIYEKRFNKNIQQPQNTTIESALPSPNNSIDKLVKGIGNISLGKQTTIEISLLIIGHGGVISLENGIVQKFTLPENVSQTNILGLRYAGLLNYGNSESKKWMDKNLHEVEILQNPKNLKKFLKTFNWIYVAALNERDSNNSFINQNERNANMLVNSSLHKKNIHLHGDYVGIRYNYGNTRAQKIYFGKKKNDQLAHIHPQEVEERPLVKIFSIKVDGIEIQRNQGRHEIFVDDIKNEVTLTEVIEKAVHKTMREFPELSTFPDRKIIVNVVDNTCNDTKENRFPDIEFIGPPESKSSGGKKKQTISLLTTKFGEGTKSSNY